MSVCGGDALDRVVVVPGPPGADGKDGVVDPSALTELAEPGDDTGVVVVDSGEAKFSRWDAFKARLAVWLEDLTATWSNKTLVDPVVEGRLVASVEQTTNGYPYSFNVVSANSSANGGGLQVRQTLRQSGNARFEAFNVFVVEETTGSGTRNLINAVFTPAGSANPLSRFRVDADGNAFLANNAPVVTTTGVQSLSNKTLVNPTIRNAVISDSRFEAANGGLVATFTGTATPGSENRIRILNGEGSVSPSIQVIGADPLANVGFDFSTFGRGLFRVNGLPVGFTSIPVSASSDGVKGQLSFDNDFLYVCVQDNSWRRAALSTW